MPTLDEIKSQIKSLDGASRMLAQAEIRELPKVLWEDEIVNKIVQGRYDNDIGVLVATNKRLVFVDKKIFGVRVEDFPYEKVSSIQYETGMVYGKLSIFTSGNRANIEHVMPKNQVRDLAEYVRAHTTSQLKSALEPRQSTEASSGDDDFRKLEKLAVMRKRGLLTEEEFTKAKRKLLS